MIDVFKKIETYSHNLVINFSPYTNVIGLSRSILAIGTLLTLLLNPSHYFFNKGIDGKYFNPLLDLNNFPINSFNFFLVIGLENTEIMKYVGVFVLLCVISGYFIKITSILHWWICCSFTLSSSLLDGGDQIASILTFLLLPICLTDYRKNHWEIRKTKDRPINLLAIISIWLIRIQVAVIYFDASVGKFKVPEWANGTAIYYWLNNSVFGITDFWKPLLNPLLSNGVSVSILTYGTLILEISLFLAFVASTKYRKRILPIAILFHFSIIIFYGIFSFFFSVATALILYLYPTNLNINFKNVK